MGVTMTTKKLASITLALSLLVGGQSAFAASSDKPVQIASSDFEYSEAAKEALKYVNGIRVKVGLDPVELNPYLVEAAENQANYIAINGNEDGHDQDPSKKGFTGKTPSDRVQAVGGSGDLVYYAGESLNFSESSVTKAIDVHMETAYHRRPIIDPYLEYIGAAINGSNFALLFSKEGHENTNKTVVYPYDGQKNVNIGFYGFEDPNPLEQFGVSKSGQIISFFAPYVLDTKKIDSTITNSKGEVLPYFSEWYGAFWFFYPKSELAYNETYRVSVNYKPVAGPDKGKTFNETWSFTTMPKPGSNTDSGDTTPSTGGWVKPDPSGGLSAVTGKFNKDNVGVSINGDLVTLNPKAMIVDGSTFIPLRGVFEKLDSEVGWNGTKQEVTITRGDTTVKLTINSKTAYINGEAITLSTAPFLSDAGSTYVPLRFASEAIGAEVGWDQQNYIAIIKAE